MLSPLDISKLIREEAQNKTNYFFSSIFVKILYADQQQTKNKN